VSLEDVAGSLDRAAVQIARLRAGLRVRTAVLSALLVVVAAAGVGGAWWSLGETERLHRVVDRDCGAFAAIATIPLPPDAAPVARQIVDGARTAYDGRCVEVGGPLPPAATITPAPTR
jgi:hypothetical protein